MGKVLRELFSDSQKQLSSGRIMQMLALVGGLAVFAFQVMNCSGDSTNVPDYELVYVALFGGALGSKAFQKKYEK